MKNDITPVKIQELAKAGDRNTLINMYKDSDPRTRELMITILAALGGFVALLKFLKELH